MSERVNVHSPEAGGVEGPVVRVGPGPWLSLGLFLALLVYACGLQFIIARTVGYHVTKDKDKMNARAWEVWTTYINPNS